MKERLQYIDALKFLAIFLVLWGHCILSLSGRAATSDSVFVFINSFHMPLFMMMVGFFAASSLKKNARTFVTDKFRALILPLIIWAIIFWMVNLLIFKFEAYNGIKGLMHNMINGFWFLKSAFFCYLLFYFINRPFVRSRHALLIGGGYFIDYQSNIPHIQSQFHVPLFSLGSSFG